MPSDYDISVRLIFINNLEYLSHGQTHSVLAFYFSDRAAYAAEKWQNYQQKQQYVDDLHKQNIKIMVSVGGGDVKPTTDKWVPADAANNVAQFVKQNALDGVDLDWEVGFRKLPQAKNYSNLFFLV